MAILYVTKSPCVIRVSFDLILVTTFSEDNSHDKYEILQECKSAMLEAIILFGKIQVTSDAVRYCLRHGINLCYFDSNGHYLGKIESHISKCTDLKLLQYKLYSTPSLRLIYAKQIIKAKLDNQISTLRYFSKNNVNISKSLSSCIEYLQSIFTKINNAKDLNELLGFEGTSARKYFEYFGKAFTKELTFEKRTHRPAKDPVNSLLSLGYVILTNLINGIVIARGYEPCIGIVHEVYSNRSSLALDLVEEFRSIIVDRFVVKYCNLCSFKKDMFYEDDAGCTKLKKENSKIFFQYWDDFINKPVPEIEINIDQRKNVREIVCQQVENLAVAIRNNAQYAYFRFKV